MKFGLTKRFPSRSIEFTLGSVGFVLLQLSFQCSVVCSLFSFFSFCWPWSCWSSDLMISVFPFGILFNWKAIYWQIAESVTWLIQKGNKVVPGAFTPTPTTQFILPGSLKWCQIHILMITVKACLHITILWFQSHFISVASFYRFLC